MTNEINAFDAYINACNAISEEQTKDFVAQLTTQIDERIKYETDKKADNNSIQDTLRVIKSKLLRAKSAQMHAVSNIALNYANYQEKSNARLNVYTLQKISYFVDSVAFNVRMNAFNYHILRSMFRFEQKELLFTHHDALCASSDKIDVDSAQKRKLLSRHNVAAVTANTQASSTMSALVIMNVVRKARNADNVNHYVLTHSALCEALKEIVMK